MRAPKTVEVKLNLQFLEVSGTWEPSDTERDAAWELYIEVVTRVAVVPLHEDEGLLREAMDSLYSLFPTTREILRRYGPAVAAPKRGDQYNLGYLAVAMLNFGLRPVLTKWHPTLEDWEASRPLNRSRADHERAWSRAPELRSDLAAARQMLTEYAATLASACGVPDFLANDRSRT